MKLRHQSAYKNESKYMTPANNTRDLPHITESLNNNIDSTDNQTLEINVKYRKNRGTMNVEIVHNTISLILEKNY